MAKDVYQIDDSEDQRYIIGDAIEELRALEGRASVIYLDDAWARPHRAGQLGVTYPTHDFEQTEEILDACKAALKPDGWLIADADDWIVPKLIQHLQDEWGNVAKTYRGGGYRRLGGVTYLTKDDEPDCSTTGAYLTSSGYPVVFAHREDAGRVTDVSARQTAQRQREQYGWGSVKPVGPYYEWLRGLYNPEDDGLLVVPCAGTAPAAIAAEQLHADGIYEHKPRYVCIDSEEGALEAFRQRRATEIKVPESATSD